MRNFIHAALLGLSVLVVSCYDEQIEELNNRVDKIENEKIATIQQQVASISTSILDMQRMDKNLQEYIEELQAQASELEEALSSVEIKIKSIEGELRDEIDDQKLLVLASLEEYKLLVSDQLSNINSSLTVLQNQAKALEEQVKALETYVDDEIQNAKDWVSATYATLENYNSLAEIVSDIQAQIDVLNNSMTAIDATIQAKVSEELAAATAGLRDSIKNDIETVANDCATAINAATEDIMAAYEADMQAAIAISETNMKSWVNTQLAGYYSVTHIDAKLASLESDFR